MKFEVYALSPPQQIQSKLSQKNHGQTFEKHVKSKFPAEPILSNIMWLGLVWAFLAESEARESNLSLRHHTVKDMEQESVLQMGEAFNWLVRTSLGTECRYILCWHHHYWVSRQLRSTEEMPREKLESSSTDLNYIWMPGGKGKREVLSLQKYLKVL